MGVIKIKIVINDRDPQYMFHYGSLYAEGRTLLQCYDSATVEVVETKTGNVQVTPVDSPWMLDLLRAEFLAQTALKKPKLKIVKRH